MLWGVLIKVMVRASPQKRTVAKKYQHCWLMKVGYLPASSLGTTVMTDTKNFLLAGIDSAIGSNLWWESKRFVGSHLSAVALGPSIRDFGKLQQTGTCRRISKRDGCWNSFWSYRRICLYKESLQVLPGFCNAPLDHPVLVSLCWMLINEKLSLCTFHLHINLNY